MADLAHLQAVAAQLAGRVRDDDPEANSRWLLAMLPDPSDRWALHFVQAAAAPVDRTWSELTAWTRGEEPEADAAFRAGRRAAAEAVRAGMRGAMPRDLSGRPRQGGRPTVGAYAEWAARLAEGSVPPVPEFGRRDYWRMYQRQRRARMRAVNA